MKKQIFTIILLLMGGVATFGQSFKLDATGANDMRLRTSGADRLTILPASGNGNVGIGTITPNAKLDLNGDLSLTKKRLLNVTGIQNALDRQGASRIFIDVSGTVTLNGIAGGVDGLMIFLYTGSLTTLVINNLDAGALSADRIATHTGATATITARGGASLIYDGAAGNWRIYGFADENSSWNSKGNTGTNPATNFIGTTDNQSFVARTNNVERMRILNTGNVGIGTNNPDTKLHLANTSTGQTAAANTILTIENNGDANLNFLSGNSTTQKSGILFGSMSGNAKGQINYTPSLNKMDFATSDVTRMSIDGTGNVGIGVAPNANSRLIVSKGVSGVTPGSNISTVIEDNTSHYLGIFSPNATETGILFGTPSGSGNNTGLLSTATSDIKFTTNASTKMIVLNNGNVGIGTNTPDAKLDVEGNIRVGETLITASSTTYDPINPNGKSVLTFNPAGIATYTVKGITAPAILQSGYLLYITSTIGVTLVLKNEAATATNNNIKTSTGADVTITDRGGATLLYVYDVGSSSGGWIMIGLAQ